MPARTLTLCPTPGCPGLWDGATCTVCQRQPQGERPRRRGEWRARQKRWYDSARWKRARDTFLRRPGNVLCAWCREKGIITASQTIDHVEAPRGDERLFWDQSNWRPSCLRCNAVRGMRGK